MASFEYLDLKICKISMQANSDCPFSVSARKKIDLEGNMYIVIQTYQYVYHMLYYIESINIYEIYTGAPLHGFNDWLQALTPFKAEAASCAVLKLNATLGRATHEAGCHEFHWI